MKVSSVFPPFCISIAIATCLVLLQLAMAQHHHLHHHANNNNHRSNVDTTDIYSRSSEKTTADAIDIDTDNTLAFVDATSVGEDGRRIEVSSNEDVAEEDEVSIIVNI